MSQANKSFSKQVWAGFFIAILICCTAFGADSAPQIKEWTFAVYINADNDLDESGVEDQNEMAKVGSSRDINVVTIIDRYEDVPTAYNYLEKGKINTIRTLGETDMGDYKFLVSFFRDVIKDYPARHYAFVIWNHGGGWKKGIETGYKWISHDFDSNHRITTEELGLALTEIESILGKKIDVFAMDACLMQMAEIIYIAKDHCDFLVASENKEWKTGYPYTPILTDLLPSTSPRELAEKIVACYGASFPPGMPGYNDATHSAIDCSKFSAVMDGIDGLSKALISQTSTEAITKSLLKTQKFSLSANVDLRDFITNLKEQNPDGSAITAIEKLDAALGEAIIANTVGGPDMANSKGMAIYFPRDMTVFDASYDELAFAKKSIWVQFLKDYYKKLAAEEILAQTTSGNSSSLKKYIATPALRTPEIDRYLISNLQFQAYCEQIPSTDWSQELSGLVETLKSSRP